jgi:broad specificity phosphatase PhoE
VTQPISASEEPIIFGIIRHGDKEKEVSDPDLTPRGVEQAKIAGAALQAFLADLVGRQKIVLISSPIKRTKQTAELMAERMGIPASEIVFDRRIRERDKINGVKEGHDERMARAHEGINENVAKFGTLDTVPIFVTHSLIMGSYLKKLINDGQSIPPEFHKRLKTCEVLIFKKEGDQITGLARVRPEFPVSAKV